MTEETNNLTISNIGFELNVDTSFFYTNDKFINSLDDNNIFEDIKTKYANISQQCTDSQIKKALIQFFQDSKFVSEILQTYNLSIFDLFKLICKQYETLFKGQYLKKVKLAIKNRSYVKNSRRKTDY